MIVAKVFGGLGNQMFQFAAGRALASRLGEQMAIDDGSLSEGQVAHNGHELSNVFKVDVPIATPDSLKRLLGWRRHRPVQRLLRKLPTTALNGRYIPEPHFQYWSGLEAIGAEAYLDGYWQSYRYVESEGLALRDEFRFRQDLAGSNADVRALIESSRESVAIHVRRGDYVSNPKASVHHGTAGVEYYVRAIGHMTDRLPEAPRFFVFSDDIAWANANLPLPADSVFVGHNRGRDSHFDMQLMSLCRHQIIANSSFSWWGAWLNNHAEKVVVAPERWFLVPYDTSTLLPPAWVRM